MFLRTYTFYYCFISSVSPLPPSPPLLSLPLPLLLSSPSLSLLLSLPPSLSSSQGWTGTSCNITLINQINTSSTLLITPSSSSSSSLLTDTPDASTAVPVMDSISSLPPPTNDVS